MKRPVLATGALLLGALALGSAGGYIAGRAGMEQRVERLVAQAYARETMVPRLEISLTSDGTPIATDGACATGQQFLPWIETPTYLDKKVGFEYKFEDVVHVRKEGMPDIPIGLFHDKYGTSATFQVERSVPHAEEKLSLLYHAGGLFQGSSVTITDQDRDGLPENIYLHGKGEVSAYISRDSDGILRYTFFDEAGARQAYDLYTRVYRAFKQEHDIDTRIKEYTPHLSITQIDPRAIVEEP